MSPILSEILLSGFMINSTLRRRNHLVQSFSVVFLYWFYFNNISIKKQKRSSFLFFLNSTGTPSGSSSQETDLLPEMDQKKRKRMISNRQSARRSRERKQKHVEDLVEQVSLLKKENGQILTILNLTRQHYVSFEAENSVLRTQMMELTSRLDSLNEIVQNMNFYGNTTEPHMMIPDNFINLWSFLCKNQPIMASSEMIQFY
ncbi:hypothetical protein M5K25_024049 [Dendrobium thyrsiflorum]|uniref:BZIP domain-containing protein n=1 Tax=Dendrobium thyrsiflorum TaxID=117978 RepID=A0ABD0U0S3_DENTH